jgi:hypothetical protein
MTVLGSKMLTGGILALIGLIVVRVFMGLFGVAMSLFSFLVSMIPVVIFAWLVYRIFKWVMRDKKKPAYE